MQFPPEVVDRVVARQGRLHAHDRIAAARTAFVVIDLQNYFTQPGYQAETAAARETFGAVNALARGLRAAGGTVIWVQTSAEDAEARWSHLHDLLLRPERRARRLAELDPGHSGFALAEGLDVRPEDRRVPKCVFSALTPLPDHSPAPLATMLEALGIETVLIGGTATNVCCESTARNAMLMDYATIMVDDCLSAATVWEHETTLTNWILHFGDVLDSGAVIARLR